MRETKAERLAKLHAQMCSLGLSVSETEQLRRIERALHRWGERECGMGDGCIERDEKTGKPYWLNSATMRRTAIRDGEAGALRKLGAIMAAHPRLLAYHQTDCRGCALYILRKRQVQDGENLDSVYTRGVAVCI